MHYLLLLKLSMKRELYPPAAYAIRVSQAWWNLIFIGLSGSKSHSSYVCPLSHAGLVLISMVLSNFLKWTMLIWPILMLYAVKFCAANFSVFCRLLRIYCKDLASTFCLAVWSGCSTTSSSLSLLLTLDVLTSSILFAGGIEGDPRDGWGASDGPGAPQLPPGKAGEASLLQIFVGWLCFCTHGKHCLLWICITIG